MPATTPALQHIPGYTFVQTLGEGTDARVYRYRQHMPNRDIAIKISHAMIESQTIKRFQYEIECLARLSAHPYVITMYDAGLIEQQFGYLVLEYAPYGSYQERIRNNSLTVEQMLDLGIRLASALHCAHQQGIIHRDIKPANVLITQQKLPALTDFGIASSSRGSDGTCRNYSLPWAAPEVLTGSTTGSEASDLYSLAATLYASLVGRSPFEYGYHPRSQAELARHICEQPLPHIGLPTVPADVETILAQAMARNPLDRHTSMLAFARQLQYAQRLHGFPMTDVTAVDIPEYPAECSVELSAALPATRQQPITQPTEPLVKDSAEGSQEHFARYSYSAKDSTRNSAKNPTPCLHQAAPSPEDQQHLATYSPQSAHYSSHQATELVNELEQQSRYIARRASASQCTVPNRIARSKRDTSHLLMRLMSAKTRQRSLP